MLCLTSTCLFCLGANPRFFQSPYSSVGSVKLLLSNVCYNGSVAEREGRETIPFILLSIVLVHILHFIFKFQDSVK